VRIIDAHQHFWQISRADCLWPDASLDAIYRDFSCEDFRADSAGQNVAATVLVQSQAADSDSDYLLALAQKEELVGAVVAWLDFSSPHASERLRHLATHTKFRGVRPMLQAIDESRWILKPEFDPIFTLLLDLNLSFDALIQPRHMPAVNELARRYPTLNIVVDHAAKPVIREGELESWSDLLASLADRANVSCKLSGLVTEASPAQCAKGENLRPWMEAIFTCFSSDRVIWGSDWPVLNLRCRYRDWLDMARFEVAKYYGELSGDEVRTEDAQNKIFYRNACRFYRIRTVDDLEN